MPRKQGEPGHCHYCGLVISQGGGERVKLASNHKRFVRVHTECRTAAEEQAAGAEQRAAQERERFKKLN